MKSNTLTRQLQTWISEFGEKYTNRNPMTIEDMDRELGEYRGYGNTDFTRLYLEQYPDLHCVRERFLHYHDSVNNEPLIDQVGLLAKHIK